MRKCLRRIFFFRILLELLFIKQTFFFNQKFQFKFINKTYNFFFQNKKNICLGWCRTAIQSNCALHISISKPTSGSDQHTHIKTVYFKCRYAHTCSTRLRISELFMNRKFTTQNFEMKSSKTYTIDQANSKRVRLRNLITQYVCSEQLR